MKTKFFEKREVSWVFATIALIFGFLFINSNPTGNVIVNKQSPVSFVSIIGLLLLVCSTVLIAYSVKKK